MNSEYYDIAEGGGEKSRKMLPSSSVGRRQSSHRPKKGGTETIIVLHRGSRSGNGQKLFFLFFLVPKGISFPLLKIRDSFLSSLSLDLFHDMMNF